MWNWAMNTTTHDVLPAERPARRNAADLDPQYPVPCGLLCIRSHPSGAGRYRTFRGSWAVAGTGLRRAGKPDLAHWPAPHELSGASRWTACMNADARHHAVSYDTRRRLRSPPPGLSSGCPILSPRKVLRGPSSLCMGSAQLPSGEPILQSAGISLPVCAEAGLPFHRTIQPHPAAVCFCIAEIAG